MGEVAAGGERHAHDGVAGLAEGEVDRQVRGRSRVGLNVGVVDGEELLGALDRQRLDRVDILLPLVVALARVALGVLVGEHRPGGFEDRARDVVLRRDQPDLFGLPALLVGDQAGDLGIGLGQGVAHGRGVDRAATGVNGAC